MLEYSVYANASVIRHISLLESPAEVIFHDVSTISLTRFHLTYFFVLFSLSYFTEIIVNSNVTRRNVGGVFITQENFFSVCTFARDTLYSEYVVVTFGPCRHTQ